MSMNDGSSYAGHDYEPIGFRDEHESQNGICRDAAAMSRATRVWPAPPCARSLASMNLSE